MARVGQTQETPGSHAKRSMYVDRFILKQLFSDVQDSRSPYGSGLYMRYIVGYVWIKENGTQGFKIFQSQAPLVNNNIHKQEFGYAGPLSFFFFSTPVIDQDKCQLYLIFVCIHVPLYQNETKINIPAISDITLSSWLLHFYQTRVRSLAMLVTHSLTN